MAIKFTLKNLLKEKNMEQKELVKITGIRQPTLSAISTNKIKELPVSVMDKICKALNCQPADFITYIEDSNSNDNEIF